MHPHDPKTTEEHRGRYPAALARLYTEANMMLRLREGEGPPRRELFDWSDGLRLAISREDHGYGVLVHISASVLPGTDLARFATRHNEGLRAAARGRFLELTDYVLPESCFSWSEAGYPHWFVPVVLVPGAPGFEPADGQGGGGRR
jgi:hypothetical protein